ncbi:MAG TPA: STAS domain-containing protein [Conexibacter sp.]
MQAFDVHSQCTDERVRVQVLGEVDLATAPRVASCLAACAPGRGCSVELDLSEVGFIDSTGVHLLLRVKAEARRECWTLTIVPSDAVRRIVSVLALQDALLGPPLPAFEASPRSSTATVAV